MYDVDWAGLGRAVAAALVIAVTSFTGAYVIEGVVAYPAVASIATAVGKEEALIELTKIMINWVKNG